MAFVSYENLIQYNGLLEADIAKKYTPSESGKGLSTNDYSDTDKNKLKDIEENAEVNAIDTVKVNGNALSIVDKAVDISVPNVPSWALQSNKPEYTATEVGADESGAASTAEGNAKSYTDKKIADLINGAPETLDTLKEVADAMKEHEDIVDALEEAIGTKVDKVDGKGLSSNDFSNNYKSAIDNLPSSYAPVNAQENVIETVKVNGTALTPSSKSVDVTVPTKASDIGAMDGSVTHLSGDVPTSRTVNGKALTSNIELTASDVGALPNTTAIPTITDTYSATSSNGMSGKAVASAISEKADKGDIPDSLPADGGNSNTVNNHTVESDVPSNASFEVVSSNQPSSQEVGDTWLKLL